MISKVLWWSKSLVWVFLPFQRVQIILKTEILLLATSKHMLGKLKLQFQPLKIYGQTLFSTAHH